MYYYRSANTSSRWKENLTTVINNANSQRSDARNESHEPAMPPVSSGDKRAIKSGTIASENRIKAEEIKIGL